MSQGKHFRRPTREDEVWQDLFVALPALNTLGLKIMQTTASEEEGAEVRAMHCAPGSQATGTGKPCWLLQSPAGVIDCKGALLCVLERK